MSQTKTQGNNKVETTENKVETTKNTEKKEVVDEKKGTTTTEVKNVVKIGPQKRILIQNLPFDTTREGVEELCTKFGRVNDIVLKRYQRGKQSIVSFFNVVDAEFAHYKLTGSTYRGSNVMVYHDEELIAEQLEKEVNNQKKRSEQPQKKKKVAPKNKGSLVHFVPRNNPSVNNNNSPKNNGGNKPNPQGGSKLNPQGQQGQVNQQKRNNNTQGGVQSNNQGGVQNNNQGGNGFKKGGRNNNQGGNQQRRNNNQGGNQQGKQGQQGQLTPNQQKKNNNSSNNQGGNTKYRKKDTEDTTNNNDFKPQDKVEEQPAIFELTIKNTLNGKTSNTKLTLSQLHSLPEDIRTKIDFTNEKN